MGGAGVRKTDRMIPQDRLALAKKFWQMWDHFLRTWPLSFKSISIPHMHIQIHKDGKNYGPYTLEQVRRFLNNL